MPFDVSDVDGGKPGTKASLHNWFPAKEMLLTTGNSSHEIGLVVSSIEDHQVMTTALLAQRNEHQAVFIRRDSESLELAKSTLRLVLWR